MLAISDLEIRRNEMIKSRSSKLRSFEFIFGMMLPKPLKYQVFFYKNEENKMHLKKKVRSNYGKILVIIGPSSPIRITRIWRV